MARRRHRCRCHRSHPELRCHHRHGHRFRQCRHHVAGPGGHHHLRCQHRYDHHRSDRCPRYVRRRFDLDDGAVLCDGGCRRVHHDLCEERCPSENRRHPRRFRYAVRRSFHDEQLDGELCGTRRGQDVPCVDQEPAAAGPGRCRPDGDHPELLGHDLRCHHHALRRTHFP